MFGHITQIYLKSLISFIVSIDLHTSKNMRLLHISKITSESPVFYKGYEPKYTPVLVYF